RCRIEQLLFNLIANAIKYGANKPIRVRVERLQAAVELQVEDQGIGISSEDQKGIFERFARVAPVQHQFSGMGLGLYISRQIVFAHGGTIRVESALGHGARFVVCLPLAGDERIAAALPVRAAGVAPTSV